MKEKKSSEKQSYTSYLINPELAKKIGEESFGTYYRLY